MNPYGQVAGVTSDDGLTQESISPDTTAPANNFTLSQAFGFFNILVGLMLVAAFLFFFGGLAAYFTRLGLENRIEGLRYMYWGVTILFVLIVLLALVNYLQFNPTVVFIGIAILVVIFVAYAAIQISQGPPKEEEH